MAVANPPAGKTGTTVITDARSGTSNDLSSRQKRYAITMGFRTACFVAMIFVPGVFRWVLLAGAIFLPYVAVLLANAPDTRGSRTGQIEKGEPEPAPQLTAGKQPDSDQAPDPSEDIDGVIEDEIR